MLPVKPWRKTGVLRQGFGVPGPARRTDHGKGAGMPTRRTMELIVITVVLLHPVIRMAHIWAAKHLATSDNSATATVAEVISTVV